MKILKCKCGNDVLVDEDVYQKLPTHLVHCSSNVCRIWVKKNVTLARFVTNCFDSNVIVDHKNNNHHDNRMSNLRICTFFWNVKNRIKSTRNTSGLIGVSRHKPSGKWKAYATTIGKGVLHLGYFDCPIKAGRARDVVAYKEYGAFAKPNFPFDFTNCEPVVP